MPDHVKTKVEQTTRNDPNESKEGNDFNQKLIATTTPGTRFKK